MHKLALADTEGLVAKIEKACARAGGPSRVLLTYEAGYEGFWMARWLGEHAPQIDVVVCGSGKLRGGSQEEENEDRPDRREAEALSLVRIPTV